MLELINKLEYSIQHYLGLHVTITFNKDQIVIHGVSSDLEEAVVGIFIKGFLASWNHRNRPLIKVHNPEAG